MSEPENQRTCEPVRFEPEHACDECGAAGAFAFDGVFLCQGCYVGRGSCCPEFGKDDLWQKHEVERTAPERDR